jgi:hypothetical protein
MITVTASQNNAAHFSRLIWSVALASAREISVGKIVVQSTLTNSRFSVHLV